MKYLTVKFCIDTSSEFSRAVAREVIAGNLYEMGFEALAETDNGYDGYIPEGEITRADIDAMLSNITLQDVRISYTIENLEDKDWNETWEKEGFEPIVIADEVTIYDVRNTEDNPSFPTPVSVGIEARQAFGTGSHQTTRMVVHTLLNIEMQGKRLLDCGCGTGILGIVASKLGASDIVAYDIDEWSVENTRHNARLNGVENIEVFTGDASVISHISGVFDVVVANINRNILLEDMPAFKDAMRPNAILILSGFYTEDAQMLTDKARELGMTEINRRTEDNWCCLTLK